LTEIDFQRSAISQLFIPHLLLIATALFSIDDLLLNSLLRFKKRFCINLFPFFHLILLAGNDVYRSLSLK